MTSGKCEVICVFCPMRRLLLPTSPISTARFAWLLCQACGAWYYLVSLLAYLTAKWHLQSNPSRLTTQHQYGRPTMQHWLAGWAAVSSSSRRQASPVKPQQQLQQRIRAVGHMHLYCCRCCCWALVLLRRALQRQHCEQWSRLAKLGSYSQQQQ